MTPNQMMSMQTQGSSTRKKEAKKEATKANAQQKSDAILASRRFHLRQNALCERHNSGLGGGEDSGEGGKETKQRRRVGAGGGKDRRRAVACAIAVLREERRMLIGVI